MHAANPKELHTALATELAAGRPQSGPDAYDKIAEIAAAQEAARAQTA